MRLVKKSFNVCFIHLEIVVTPNMIRAKPAGSGEYRFQKIFSEGQFIGSGLVILPVNGQKPTKNSHDSALVNKFNLDFRGFNWYRSSSSEQDNLFSWTRLSVFCAKRWCIVYVGNQYRLNNLGRKECRLFFCHAKEINSWLFFPDNFKYIEFQLTEAWAYNSTLFNPTIGRSNMC